ncbi:MAG: damage-inducible protein DinB, partial [Mesorhizobium sp.]
PFDNAAALAAAQADFDRKLIAFCDGLTDADLDRRVITDRREDGMIPERIGDILGHVFLHDIHHRGQVHAMFSGTSVAPPQLDEFLLDYDIKLRKDEVERLGL